MNSLLNLFIFLFYIVTLIHAQVSNDIDDDAKRIRQECGVKRDLLNIVGGIAAQPNAYPWTVAIYTKGKFVCGGAILDNYWIITAAHCLVDNFGRHRTVQVKIGAHEINRDGILLNVAHAIPHERYKPWSNKNDIGLIKTAVRMNFTDKVSPVCLPTKDLDKVNLSDKTATAVGWGTVKFKGNLSPILLEVELPFIDLETCQKSYEHQMKINRDMICAGYLEGGKDTCQGDSGGPLIYQASNESPCVLIGVVSFGYKCAEKGYPGVYTKVTSFLGWIEQNKK